MASAYAALLHLFTVRDSAESALTMRTKTVSLFRQRHKFGLETLASVRQVEAKQAAAEAELLAERNVTRVHGFQHHTQKKTQMPPTGEKSN